ncbi:hypothetical protein N9A86_04695 [Akkermansiaceae bacterium]|nr:hypothetical protein [Akkermansiaceae bacterium]
MTAIEALGSLTEILNEEEIPYMVVGSFSSNYHGIPRSTKDADIVMQFDRESWEVLSGKLPDCLVQESQGSFEMVTATRKEVLRLKDSPFEIEIFHLSEDLFDQERFRRREKVELSSNHHAWLATAEDVIVQKLRWAGAAKRSKDFDDVVNVLLRQASDGALDFRYIKKWCAEHRTTELLEEARVEAGQLWAGVLTAR